MSKKNSKASNDNRQLSLFENNSLALDSDNPQSIQQTPFEQIRHIDESGNEYWLARELQPLLDYKQWRFFEEVIDRAKISAKVAGYVIEDLFALVRKKVEIGSGAEREIDDYKLTKSACYWIAMNGDVRKKVIADAQAYFVVQVIRQENLSLVLQQFIPMARAIIAEMTQPILDKQIALEKELRQLEAHLSPDYETIVGYINRNRLNIPFGEHKHYGQLASQLSRDRQCPIGSEPDKRWGKVNRYHKDILREIFGK